MDFSVIKLLCPQLRNLAKFFRFVELCTLIVLLLWTSTRLPFAVKISGEYFRKFAALLFSPTSIFLLGNAIVVMLLAKSGLFSAGDSSAAVDIAVADLYRKLRSDDADEIDTETSPLIEEVVFQDKEVIVYEQKVSLQVINNNNINEEKNVQVFTAKENAISYRRSKSERFKSNEDMKKDTEKLRRSETDISRKSEVMAEEGDGGEEFRRTIEAFIAKQVRFHREESLAVVIHGQAAQA